MEAEFEINVFLKAVVQERIVGSVRGLLKSGTCSIGRLIVHPDYQGKSIGTALMKSIESVFIGAKRFELFTGTKSIDNIRLYRRLGYEDFREEDLTSEVRLLFMEKDNDNRQTRRFTGWPKKRRPVTFSLGPQGDSVQCREKKKQ